MAVAALAASTALAALAAAMALALLGLPGAKDQPRDSHKTHLARGARLDRRRRSKPEHGARKEVGAAHTFGLGPSKTLGERIVEAEPCKVTGHFGTR